MKSACGYKILEAWTKKRRTNDLTRPCVWLIKGPNKAQYVPFYSTG